MEDFITESLNSTFPISRNAYIENFANSMVGSKVHKDDTRAWQSPELRQHGISVLKLRQHEDGPVEYHINNEKGFHKDLKVPTKAMLHIAKIIFDDGKQEISAGKTIRLQSPDHEQFKSYQQIAKYLATKHGAVVRQVPDERLLSIPNQRAPTLRIAGTHQKLFEDVAEHVQRFLATMGLVHPESVRGKTSGTAMEFYGSGTGQKLVGRMISNDGERVTLKDSFGKYHRLKVAGKKHLSRLAARED